MASGGVDDDGPAASASGRGSGPSIRFDSAKVSPVEPVEEESLIDATSQSKFSLWRAARQSLASSSPSNDDQLKVTRIAVQKPWYKTLKGLGYTFVTLIVLAALFIFLVFYSPLLAVKTITVRGTSLVSQTRVQEQLSPLEGKPLTRISQQQVKELVASSTIVRDVAIEAHPPHELVVTDYERVPIALVEDQGKLILVDAQRQQLGQVDSLEQGAVPQLAGGLAALESDNFLTVAQVLVALPASLLAQVGQVKADSASTITLEMKDGSKVVWGSAADSELKVKVLSELMDALGQDGKVSVYDVSSPLVPTTK